MSEVKLKPCPFCGGTDLDVIRKSDFALTVHCRDCLADGRISFPICWTETDELAVEAWNHRPAEDKLKAEVERLRERANTPFRKQLIHILKEQAANVDYPEVTVPFDFLQEVEDIDAKNHRLREEIREIHNEAVLGLSYLEAASLKDGSLSTILEKTRKALQVEDGK